MASAAIHQIEKNVPLPGQRRNTKYPFNRMEVGDSFFIAEPDPERRRIVQQRVGGYACTFRPSKFATRSVDGGVRVWRTA